MFVYTQRVFNLKMYKLATLSFVFVFLLKHNLCKIVLLILSKRESKMAFSNQIPISKKEIHGIIFGSSRMPSE